MSDLDQQRKLLASLRKPACFPHAVDEIRIIETHISWVLLTGAFAYKIKKAMDLGFLDFSSLDKRKHYCEEELRLNRRFSDIYISVVPITGDVKAPGMDGKGPILDYAVKMKEFPQTALLSHLAEHHRIKPELIDQLAGTLAGFHKLAAPVDSNHVVNLQFETFDAIAQPIRENFKQLRNLSSGSPEDEEKLKLLEQWSEQQLERLKPVFAERQARGFIRECHGDLHLGNIAVVDGNIQFFDCIEFDPWLRWIDTFSELAFLLMDLEDFNYHRHAGSLLDRYLELTSDYEGLRLLPFYKAYRAMVRVKVNAIRMEQSGLGPAQWELARAAYQRYLCLAQENIDRKAPFLAIMHGVSGTGKSTISARVAGEYGAVRLRSDVERKRLHNLAANESSYSELKAGIYSNKSTDKTYARLAEISRWVLSAGYPVIVDATFLSRIKRHDFMTIANDFQIPFLILDCQASEATLLTRLEERMTLKGDASEADVAVMQNQMENQNRLSVAEKHWTITVNTEENFDPKNLLDMFNRPSMKSSNNKTNTGKSG